MKRTKRSISSSKKKLVKYSPKSKRTRPSLPDYFTEHFNTILEDPVAEQLKAGVNTTRKIVKNLIFDECSVTVHDTGVKVHDTEVAEPLNFEGYHHASNTISAFKKTNPEGLDDEQKKLFQIIGRYVDLCYITNSKSYFPLLSLHAYNHIIRTREIILENSNKLKAANEDGSLTDEMIESCRDQGLSRPKVLFIAPMKKYAYDFIKNLIDLVAPSRRKQIDNLERFEEEFGDTGIAPIMKNKADYRELMAGNIDDCFRIGIEFKDDSLKLYQQFNRCDILICSPLGIRMIVGDEGEKQAESDFLASIEVVIVDRANIILMQNWEHLIHLLNTVNRVPKKVSSDITRVREWSTQNYDRLYRQLLIFSEFNFTELHSLFAEYSKNYAGGIAVMHEPKELLSLVEKPLLQEFHRFDCQLASNQSDLRFDYFVRNVLTLLEHKTMIFVPSYFNFVRLRNHMKKENESFVQLHEYAEDNKISRARDMFYHRRKKLIVMTERFYFFKRFHIKGVEHIVFYQLPSNPTFYHELINDSSAETKLESKVIFSKFDLFRLQNIFGKSQAKELIKSDKKFHALVSE